MSGFLYIFLFLTVGMIASAAEVVEINSAFVRDLDAGREVRHFERLLTRLVRQRNSRICRLNLEFGDPAAKPGIAADFSVVPWHVTITGGRAWAKNLILASQLGGILAAAHAGASAKEAAHPLPQWLTAALFHTKKERSGSEYYTGINRRFLAAGALLQNGVSLNPNAFAYELNSPANSAERFWQQEFSRLLLDLSLRYSPESFGTKIPYAKNRLFAGKKNTLQYSTEELSKNVWQNPEIVPFPILEREFQELMKIQISALDKEGVPTGESVEITLEQLPDKLKKHPEARTIRNSYQRRIQEFSRRVPGELTAPLARLVLAIKKLDGSAESAENLRRMSAVCNAALNRRKTRSAILDDVEKKQAGLQRFAAVFSCDWSFSMLGEKEKKFLNQTEQFFNR